MADESGAPWSGNPYQKYFGWSWAPVMAQRYLMSKIASMPPGGGGGGSDIPDMSSHLPSMGFGSGPQYSQGWAFGGPQQDIFGHVYPQSKWTPRHY
jgi:hypothetical protein